MATDREVVARPRLVVLPQPERPQRPRSYLWPLMRPLVWFGVRWVAAFVVLVVLFEHRFVVAGVLVEPYLEGLTIPAAFIAAIPDGAWLFDESGFRPEDSPGGKALFSVLFGPLAPWVYAFRLLRELWRMMWRRG